ncbi:MAG TPA: hypothetical protein DIV86_06965 [Alphaproteobacteria bacterium]|nr:hypothetical protein [Alphaproteobacteria bacterium]
MLSVKGKIYTPVEKPNEAYVTAVMQKFGISDMLARLLAARRIELHDIENFLDPKIKNFLPEPYDFMDMEKGVNFIFNAVKNQKKIFIYGDYDVDGCAASSILKLYFADLGVATEVYIPNRFKEGYGINLDAIEKLHKQGAELIITVDCGVTSFEPLEKAKEFGIDVIVLDHHLGMEQLPHAIAIINPNRIDEASPYKHLCASGLAFILIAALNRKFEQGGWFKKEIGNSENNTLNPNSQFLFPKTKPSIMRYLDLAALGTVCDVMLLKDVNRAIVSAGIKILQLRNNIGLKHLLDIAGVKENPDAYSLGFMLGPRINAAGRLDDASYGLKLLTSNDEIEAKQLAEKLNQLNKERQEIEKANLAEAVEMVLEQQVTSSVLPLLAGGVRGGGIRIGNREFTTRDPISLEKALALRKNQNEVEGKLWFELRNKINEYSFRRQHPIGNYVVDFICVEAKLIIEVDGATHSENQDYDNARTKYLNQAGYRVIRFWNFDVMSNIEGVLTEILEELNTPPSNSPRKREEDYSALVLHSKNWHQGVIGIIAGRLKEQFNKPALVISVENGVGKGSARSVSGVDIGSAIAEAKANGLLINGGGHAAAAGFTIDMNRIDEFKTYINNKIESAYQSYISNNSQKVDLVLNVNSVTLELAEEIEKLEPFGNGNPTPVIMLENAKIVKINIYAEKHIAIFVSDGRAIKAGYGSLKCVAFNAVNTPLQQAINENLMKNVSLIGEVKKNFWNGNYNVDFVVEDLLSSK